MQSLITLASCLFLCTEVAITRVVTQFPPPIYIANHGLFETLNGDFIPSHCHKAMSTTVHQHAVTSLEQLGQKKKLPQQAVNSMFCRFSFCVCLL